MPRWSADGDAAGDHTERRRRRGASDRKRAIPTLTGTKTLDVHVKRLRAQIESDPGAPASIVTIRGLGYKFERQGRAMALG